MKTCKILNCDNKHYCKDFCRKHYYRFQRYGDPLYMPYKNHTGDSCIIEGCNNITCARGFCNIHYKRFRLYGDPLNIINESHGMSQAIEYRTWANMKARCYYKNNNRYKYYGERGITVCDRWMNSFSAFYEDMGLKPFPKAQIDRINNNLGYFPENCHWVTNVENTRHQSTTKLTMKKAKAIREKYNYGNVTHIKLSNIYGVRRRTIGDIINQKIWKEITSDKQALKRRRRA